MVELFFVIMVLLIIGLIISILGKYDVFHKPTNEEIGEYGENYVSQFLSNIQDSVVFNDVILLDSKTKKSSQIDHVVVRPNGIFVIETKNYAGRIYGNDNQREWTQVLAYGEIKNRFYNPIKQNATHIYFLAKALKLYDIYVSVIVFPRAELYVQTAAHICSEKYSLLRLLNSETGILLTAEQIQIISARLTEIKDNPQITKEEHVQKVLETQYGIANNICPRCGKTLVLRNGKNGQFYGCSGYPDCRFTKKA